MAGSGNVHLRDADEALLRVEDLVVHFPAGGGRTVHAVTGVSLDLVEGETLGLVGESGCGKSTTGKAVLQVPSPTSGSIKLDGVELTDLSPDDMRRTRPTLQMIYQDPISSLNPRRSVRDVVAEPLFVWWEEEEGRPALSTWFEQYGQLFQRAAKVLTAPLKYLMPLASLAMVLWIFSETVEGRSLEDSLAWLDIPARVIGFPVLAVLCLIFGLLGALGAVWLLLAAMVPFGVVSRQFGDVSAPLGLAGAGGGFAIGAFFLYRTWNTFGGWAKALNSTVMGLLTVVLAVWFIASLLKPARAGASGLAATLAGIVALQVFYIAGLDDNPKLIVLVVSIVIDLALFVLVREKFRAAQNALRERAEPRVREVLETVGINPNNALDRKPFEFSGGQAQRISIARALIMDPKIIICDEPVSALDVSVQAQILNLLEEMKERYGLSLVFIAHDLAVVKNVSDRVAVMYLGKLCEVGDPDTLYANPAHPYTSLLLSAIPQPDPDIDQSAFDRLDGELPSPMDPPSGCRFRTRCPRATERCAVEEPTMRELEAGQFVACHFPLIGEVAP